MRNDRKELIAQGKIKVDKWVPTQLLDYSANRAAKEKLQAESRQKREDERQLVELSAETKQITKSVIDAISSLKPEGDVSRFQSVRLAIRSIWNERQIKSLETNMDNIRKQIDTALLFSVRNRLDDLNLGSMSDVQRELFGFIANFDSKHRQILDAISSSSQIGSYQTRHETLQNAITVEEAETTVTVENLTSRMDNLAQAQAVLHFKQIVCARLKFDEMPDRLERIPRAFESTFVWIFGSPDLHADNGSWANFAQWLSSSENEHIYWITGGWPMYI
jgi:hypothetical protein